MTPLAPLALEEYRRRKAAFDEAVNQRGYNRQQAERTLRCWASIALAAHVPPADLGEVIAHWQAERALSDSWARHILLWEGPPEAEWQAELARAFHAATAKRATDPARHALLETLAAFLLPPAQPLEKAA